MTEKIDTALAHAEELMNKIRSNIARFDGIPFDQRGALGAEIDRQISELDTLVNRMNNDLRSVGPSDRDYYNGEIQDVRSKVSQMTAEMRQKRQAMANSPEYKQQQQVQKNLDKSNKIVDNLDEAIREANDGLTTGNRTLTALHEDRKLIENIDRNLMQAHMGAKEGMARAKRMLRRICFNKIIIWIIVVVLVGLLGLSLYLKLVVIPGKNKESPTPAAAMVLEATKALLGDIKQVE